MAIQISNAGLPARCSSSSIREPASRARFIVPVVCRWQSQDLAARLVRSSRLGSGILDGVLASRVCARLRCLFGSGGPTLSAMWRDKICSVRELYDGLLAQSCHKKKRCILSSTIKPRLYTYPWRASCAYLGLDSVRSHFGQWPCIRVDLYIIKATTAQRLLGSQTLPSS